MKRTYAVAAGAMLALAGHSALGALSTSTVSFQQGADGYAGTFDARVGSGNTDNGATIAPSHDPGADVAEYFVDGYGNNSPDEQALIRFDNIIGNGPGQIPQGAFVLSATLQVTTGTSSANAKTPGPWGVAGVLTPFDANTVYSDFGPEGPSFTTGSATRAVGFFNAEGQTIEAGTVQEAPVAPIVNAWTHGIANNGLAIQAGRVGTTDGWQIDTSSHSTIENRPKLSVTYTTDPVATVSFQEGVNGYNGTSMAWLQMNNTTTDGSTLGEAFLDGFDGGSSPDDQALLKFSNLFASQGGSIPDDAEIVQAWLVITTGTGSSNARTRGGYEAYQMLQNWDMDANDPTLPTLFGEFNFGSGPTAEYSTGVVVDPAASAVDGMTAGSQAYFDVTSILDNWQAGQDNFGFSVQAGSTTDGWQINFTGADPSARPQLIVSYATPGSSPVPEPAALSLLAIPAALLLRRRHAR